MHHESARSCAHHLRNAGANWVDRAVVVDNGLVTSRSPDDLKAFCPMLIDEIDTLPRAQPSSVAIRTIIIVRFVLTVFDSLPITLALPFAFRFVRQHRTGCHRHGKQGGQDESIPAKDFIHDSWADGMKSLTFDRRVRGT